MSTSSCPPGSIQPHNYLLVKYMVLQCIVNACSTNEHKKKIFTGMESIGIN